MDDDVIIALMMWIEFLLSNSILGIYLDPFRLKVGLGIMERYRTWYLVTVQY